MDRESDSSGNTVQGLRPFKKGSDPRRGHGPQAGAPNAGRPPDAVRAACREAFADRVPILAELADSGPPEVRLRALDMLGRYGLGTSFTVDAPESGLGVVILPELKMREFQESRAASQHLLPGSSTVSGYVEEEYEYVIEDLTLPGPPQEEEEETVDPEIVRKVLEARKSRDR